MMYMYPLQTLPVLYAPHEQRALPVTRVCQNERRQRIGGTHNIKQDIRILTFISFSMAMFVVFTHVVTKLPYFVHVRMRMRMNE